MPKCIHCTEVFGDSLRRCPHCGEAQDDRGLERPGAHPGAGPAPLNRVARRRRKRMAIVAAVAGLLGVVAVVALPGGVSQPDQPEAPPKVLGSKEWVTRRFTPPTEIKAGQAADGFAIESVEIVRGGVLVEGRCSPLAALDVTVAGRPAVRSPDGNRFEALVPRTDGPIEVVVRGVRGDKVRLVHDAPVDEEPLPVEDVRLTNYVAGATVYTERVVLKTRAEGDSRADLELEELALRRVENRFRVGAREVTLYRAPEGLVYLRTTARGQRTFLREADGAEMVLVPGGIAKRGQGETPPHGPMHVMVLGPYLIDRTEVTCAQYAVFLRYMRRQNDPSLLHADDPGRQALRPLGWTADRAPEGRGDHPVAGVTWFGAYAYARWVGGRLPTEAEWERAAAGPAGTPFPWGPDFDADRCRWQASGPLPAASLPEGEGPCSLLHASGNVREWCDDRFDPRWYERAQRTNPRGPSRGKHRVVRGGSFASPAEALRLQHRGHLEPQKGYADVGFRVVRPWSEWKEQDGE